MRHIQDTCVCDWYVSLYVRPYMYVFICTSLYVRPYMYVQHLAGLNAYDREQERIKMQKLAELAKM